MCRSRTCLLSLAAVVINASKEIIVAAVSKGELLLPRNALSSLHNIIRTLLSIINLIDKAIYYNTRKEYE